MTQYDLTNYSGAPLVTILPLENDGRGSKNTPIPVTYVNKSSDPYFVVLGDYSSRFTPGFEFDAIGGSTYDGHYTTVRSNYHPEHNTTWVHVDHVPTPSETIRRGNSLVNGAGAPKYPELTYAHVNESTSLLLVGHGATDYNDTTTWGEVVQQNLIYLAENFAGHSAPSKPLVGQQWYDRSTNRLNVWNGEAWDAGVVSSDLSNAVASVSLEIPPLPTSPGDPASKRYVDGYVNGVMWKSPILDPNLVSDALSEPPMSPEAHDTTYLVRTGVGEWLGYDGHIVAYDGARWYSVLGRPVKVGDRFGVLMEPSDDVLQNVIPTGVFSGKAGQIATVVDHVSMTFSFELPTEPDAIAVVPSRLAKSYFAGRAYTFKGTYGRGEYGTGWRWIEFVFNPMPQKPMLPPTSSQAPGELGDIAADEQYVYVRGANAWVRIKAELF